MLPAGRVSHSPAIAEAGLRPRAAITNVGPSLRGPGRALTPGGDASNRSDPMLNRFDPHLWRTMPTEYGLVLPRAPASLEPSTGGSPFAEGASGLGAHGLIRWAWMPSSRLWGMDHPRPLVQRGGDQAGAPAPDQTLNAKPRHGAPSAYVKVRPVRVSLHSRFDLIFANRACASAMMRTTAVAMFARPRGSGLVTLDAAGHVISTAGGLSAGRINSIRTVSPLGVIWPAANSMRDDVDTAGSFRSRPR